MWRKREFKCSDKGSLSCAISANYTTSTSPSELSKTQTLSNLDAGNLGQLIKQAILPYSRRMEPEIKDAPTWMKAILTVIYSLLLLSTIVGNYLVLRAFFKFSSLQSASNAILVSFSVLDFC